MSAISSEPVRPVILRRQNDGLFIEWSDGVRTFTTWRHLRSQCPCATCIDKRAKPPDPFHVLSPQEAEAGAPEPVQMVSRGHYAYQIVWNDGHDTGIYSLDVLRELSEKITNGSQ